METNSLFPRQPSKSGNKGLPERIHFPTGISTKNISVKLTEWSFCSGILDVLFPSPEPLAALIRTLNAHAATGSAVLNFRPRTLALSPRSPLLDPLLSRWKITDLYVTHVASAS
jgi:hypothetical protein